MSEYKFSAVSIKREGKIFFEIRCLRCLCLLSSSDGKTVNKIVNCIVLPESEKTSKILKIELEPVKGYKPTFETLPCSIKEKIVLQLLSDHEEILGDFNNCANKKCVKLADTF